MILGMRLENLMTDVDIDPVFNDENKIVRAEVRLCKNENLSVDLWDYLSNREQDFILDLLEGVQEGKIQNDRPSKKYRLMI